MTDFQETIEFINSDAFRKRIIEIAESIDRVFSNFEQMAGAFQKLPERIRCSAETWAGYGWVPFLPTFDIEQYQWSMGAPKTQEEADEWMRYYFETETTEELFSEINRLTDWKGCNRTTVQEAIQCYEHGFYTSCALDVFALIDGCLLLEQPIRKGGDQRDLARNAVKRVYDNNNDCKYVISALAVKICITELFENQGDFKKPETGLKRNRISHGMNDYCPDQLDCLRLLVLLYNVLLLFKTGLYTWNVKEDGK